MSQQTLSRPRTEHAPRTNPMAVWALVLSIVTLGGIGSLLGIVLGAKARSRTRSSGERGYGIATAAVVVGIITLLAAVGYWIYLGAGSGGSTGGNAGGGY